MNLSSGDHMLVSMSAGWTDTTTIDLGAELHSVPFHSSLVSRWGAPSGSPVSEGSLSRTPLHGPNATYSPPPAVPRLSPDVSRMPTPQPAS